MGTDSQRKQFELRQNIYFIISADDTQKGVYYSAIYEKRIFEVKTFLREIACWKNKIK